MRAAGCGSPGCKHDHSILYLHSRCHPKSAVEVKYVKADSELVIECSQCGQLVCRIQIK
jgi:hypothetical protein